MPNWANVSYQITGSKESIDRLNNIIDELVSAPSPRVKNGFGKLWLGCIVDALGGKWEEVTCRGQIYERSRVSDISLDLDMEMAWGELSDFREFLEKTLNVHIIYYCEEPGMATYCHNDPDGPKYHIEVIIEDETYESDFIDDFETIQMMIDSYINKKPKDFADAIEICNKFNNLHVHDEAFSYIKVNEAICKD
ncbi:MAG: hypothetical protein KBT28_06915 [Bacteroidales bacterium]|nr:hypothetical protein [Candidatus Colimorpha merdihippi]